MSSRPKPVEKIRWTNAEKVNAVVWATEWGLTVFCDASAFAGIVATRTSPTYVFLPTTALAVILAALSFRLRGKLRTVFKTQERAGQENTGRWRIEKLYGKARSVYEVEPPRARHALIESVENDTTQHFLPVTKEYTSS